MACTNRRTHTDIWHNGKIVKDLTISFHTHALCFSTSCFEGIRCYGGIPFKLEEHIDRFQNSTSVLYMKLENTKEEIMAGIEEICRTSEFEYGYVRLIAWYGDESYLMNPLDSCSVHVAASVIETSRTGSKNPLKLHISRWRRPDGQFLPYGAKLTAGYAIAAITQIEANKMGYDDGVMLDARGAISETSIANIFFVKGNMVVTPALYSCLPGITRMTVLNIAVALGYQTMELDFTLHSLGDFEAAFVTGTALELKPISMIDVSTIGVKHKFDTENPVLRALSEAFDEEIRICCRQQDKAS